MSTNRHGSSRRQSSGYCPYCEKRQRLLQDQLEMSTANIVAGVITSTLWWIVWLPYAYITQERPYRCQECGTVVEPGSELENRTSDNW